MSRTISTTEAEPGTPPDIDGTIADSTESLRQRIRSAIRFRLGEWFYAPGEGLDYNLILGHTTSTQQVAQVLIDAINREGGDEITGLHSIEYGIDRDTRLFRFSCVADTIYLDSISITEEIPGA